MKDPTRIKSTIILQLCNGALSIMTEQNSNEWLKFEDFEEAMDYLQKEITTFTISAEFHIVQYCGKAHIDQEIIRKLIRLKEI